MNELIQTQPPRQASVSPSARDNGLFQEVEYLYLSRQEQKRIVQRKVGYRWKLLLTRAARATFEADVKRGITAMLNDLGADGWQLTGITTVTLFGTSLGCDMIFQRAVRR